MMAGVIRLYILDLESTNSTFLNNERIEAERYYKLIAQVSIWVSVACAVQQLVMMTGTMNLMQFLQCLGLSTIDANRTILRSRS